MTIDEMRAQSRTTKKLSIDEMRARIGTAPAQVPTKGAFGKTPEPALTYQPEPKSLDIDLSTPEGRQGLGLAQLATRRKTNAERFVEWTLRKGKEYAPYIIGGEAGAAVAGGSVARRMIGSAVGQGLVGGIKEGMETGLPLEGLKAGAETALGTYLGERFFTGRGIKSARARGVPDLAIAGTAERSTLGRIQEMTGSVTPKEEADVAREAAGATKEALRNKSQGRLEAEGAIAFRDSMRQSLGMEPGVDTTAVKNALREQITPNATLPETQALNQWLEDRAASLPNKMTHEQLDGFIQEWSKAVKATYGKDLSQITVPQSAKRGVVDEARALRDKLLPEVAPAFKEAEFYMGSTQKLQRMLMNAKGEVREGAPGIWRKAMESDILYQKLLDFDKATGYRYDVTRKGMELARKKIWSKGDAADAVSWLRISSSRATPSIAVRPPSSIGKGMLMMARPLGTATSGLFGAAATKVGSITSKMMAERYKEESQKTPEELFPGMTNVGGKP